MYIYIYILYCIVNFIWPNRQGVPPLARWNVTPTHPGPRADPMDTRQPNITLNRAVGTTSGQKRAQWEGKRERRAKGRTEVQSPVPVAVHASIGTAAGDQVPPFHVGVSVGPSRQYTCCVVNGWNDREQHGRKGTRSTGVQETNDNQTEQRTCNEQSETCQMVRSMLSHTPAMRGLSCAGQDNP